MSRHPAAQGLPDANQAAVIDWYEGLMCQVADLHKMGSGFPDLLVKIPTTFGAILDLVEVKAEGATASKSQVTFHRDFYPFVIVRTRDDVHAHVARVREKFK